MFPRQEISGRVIKSAECENPDIQEPVPELIVECSWILQLEDKDIFGKEHSVVEKQDHRVSCDLCQEQDETETLRERANQVSDDFHHGNALLCNHDPTHRRK